MQGADGIEKSFNKSGEMQKLYSVSDRTRMPDGRRIPRIAGCSALDRLLPMCRMYEVQNTLSQPGGRGNNTSLQWQSPNGLVARINNNGGIR